MMSFLLGAALVVAPFFIKTGAWTTTVQSQEFFLALSSVFFVVVFGIKSAHRNILLMSALLILFAFTTHNPFGVFQYYQLFMSFAGVAFIAFVYSHRFHIDHYNIKLCLGAVCLIECAWMTSQSFGYNPHSEIAALLDAPYKIVQLKTHEMPGSLGNVNHSAMLVAATMFFLPIKLWIIPGIILAICGSAFPVICAGMGVVAYISYRFKNYLALKIGFTGLLSLAVATILGAFSGTYFSDSNRVKAWTALYEKIGLQLWGKGLGWVPEIFSKTLIGGEKFYQLHNEWLELYAIGGLLSVAVGVYLIAPIFKNKGNPSVNACLIALTVNSLGNFTFHIAPLFMVFAYCYAVQLDEKIR
jgi:hypothetical protein